MGMKLIPLAKGQSVADFFAADLDDLARHDHSGFHIPMEDGRMMAAVADASARSN